jgi:hypothetical protein
MRWNPLGQRSNKSVQGSHSWHGISICMQCMTMYKYGEVLLNTIHTWFSIIIRIRIEYISNHIKYAYDILVNSSVTTYTGILHTLDQNYVSVNPGSVSTLGVKLVIIWS